MAPLTANREIDHYLDQELREFPVSDDVRIFKGAIVGINATDGLARPLVAGDALLGIAYEEADNSGGAAGAIKCRVYTKGDFEHALAGVSATDRGAPVYASDDGTLTLAATSNTFVGYVVNIPKSGVITLRLETFTVSP